MKRWLLITICLWSGILAFAYAGARAQNASATLNCVGNVSIDTAQINTLITYANGTQLTIRAPVLPQCSVNTVTVPSNIVLDWSQAQPMVCNSGQTCTVNGPYIVAPGKALFTGSGTIAINGKRFLDQNDIGTTSGKVAAGDDSRIAGAAQKTSNLSDLANAATARTNLGLSAIAASGSASDLGAGTMPTARFPGGAFNGISELVQLDGAGKLPALDASQLLNLPNSGITCGGTNDTALLASQSGVIIINAGVTCASNTQTLSQQIFYNGGTLKPLNSQTVTLTGGQYGSNGQRFTNALSGQGTISFTGNVQVGEFSPRWWGAVSDGVTDDTAAFRACAAAITTGSIYRIPPGTSVVTSTGTTPAISFTTPVMVEGYGTQNNVLGVKSGTATTVPIIQFTPPTSVAQFNGNLFFRVSNFRIAPFVNAEGGDAIQFNIVSGGPIYLAEVDHMAINILGGKDVHVANDNGAGGPNEVNGTIHLSIHDNFFTNGVLIKYGSDSLSLCRNFFSSGLNNAGKRGFEATFISGAANITLEDNTFTMDGGVLFHNGFNPNVIRNYFEMQNASATGSHNAMLDMSGDVAQIKGGMIAGNLFVGTAAAAAVDGVRLDNVSVIDITLANWTSVTAGRFGFKTTANTANPKFCNQNTIAGSSLQDNATSDANGILYCSTYESTVAGLPAHPYPNLTIGISDGTPGSNPLTGGGGGTRAVYIGGVWKSL